MRWWTAADEMNSSLLKRELLKQRIAFSLALFNASSFMAWANVRAYLDFIGDHYADRTFVGQTLFLVPIWGLCWFISLILVGESILRCKRITLYGLVALAVDAVPAMLAVLVALYGYWMFLTLE